MFEQRSSRRDEALGLIASGVDALLALDLDDLTDEEARALLAAVEQQARRLPAVAHRLVSLADRRGLARRLGLRDTAALLRKDLQLSPGEARARCRAAEDLAPGVTAEGEPAAPDLPIAAAAQARGQLSVAQARVVQEAVGRVPVPMQAGHAGRLEEALVHDAERLDPGRLARRADQLLAELDSGQVRRQEAEHRRLRGASLVLNPDGSADLRAHLTPGGAAIVQAALPPLAAPRSDDAAGRDERTAPQRLHDAVVEACRRLIAAKEIPGEGGVPATVIVTVPLADLMAPAGSPVGTATTQYGGALTIHELLQVAGEALVVPVVVDEHQAPLHVGRAKRFASKEQTYALIARDKGCSFPDCDHPPPWTQRHHIRPWLQGGSTDIVNLTLLCVYHHANFEALGWECVLIDGVVWWRPPASVDPLRRLVRNTAHDGPQAASAARLAA